MLLFNAVSAYTGNVNLRPADPETRRRMLASAAVKFAEETLLFSVGGAAAGIGRLGLFGRTAPVVECIEAERGLKVATGGLRNELPLTESEKSLAIEYAKRLGMPEESISFTEHSSTSYYQNWDQLRIGTDMLPAQSPGLGTLTANSRVSWRGALAHEIVGHRASSLSGMTHANPLLEEVQASIRAARFAPDLSSVERTTLLRDAITRLNNAGLRIRDVRDDLWISSNNTYTPGISK